MLQRVHVVGTEPNAGGAHQSAQRPPESGGAEPRHPHVAGDLSTLLDHRPVFRSALRGYDRLEVDNYVSWAEAELAAAQREREHLLDRVVACGTDLEISRRLLAEQPVGRDRPAVSARVAEILRLAEEQAAQVLEAAEAEAAQLLADARLEADARLRKAHEVKELAIDVADQLRADAQRDRAEAAAVLEQARTDATELLHVAAAERDRLAAAAEVERIRVAEEARQETEEAEVLVHERLAALRAEVADLNRQRDQARESLRSLTDRIGAALQAVGVPPAEELVLLSGRREPVAG